MDWNRYKSKIVEGLNSFNFDEEIPEILKDSLKNDQKIFVAGNGGSTSIANHYSCDFSKGAVKNWKENKNRYKVISLSNNLSYLTAIANDENYREVFKQQLINLADQEDILILISSSGNSPNVVAAAEYGNEIGMITIGVTGFSGGKLMKTCKFNAHVDTDMYETAEDLHSVFGHFLAVWLREDSSQ